MLGVIVINLATKNGFLGKYAVYGKQRDTVFGKTHVQIYEVAEQYYTVWGIRKARKKTITLD